MGLLNRHLVLLLVVVFTTSIGCVAQQAEDKPLNAKWLQNDLDGVKFLVRLMPVENLSIPELKKRFEAIKENTSWFDESNLGFGARRARLNMGLGYTSIYIDFLLFRNKIVHYTIVADVDKKVALTEHGTAVKRVWKENGGPSFVEKNNELIFEKDYPEVWKSYEDYLTARLGPKTNVSVPEGLKGSYELLTNPFENSRISTVACDDGKPAIDELESAKRTDLIENALRGYNPGGRIYAAISLLRMKRKGNRLSAATQRTINRILTSDAEAAVCHGDIGTSGLTAHDIVWDFVLRKDW